MQISNCFRKSLNAPNLTPNITVCMLDEQEWKIKIKYGVNFDEKYTFAKPNL